MVKVKGATAGATRWGLVRSLYRRDAEDGTSRFYAHVHFAVDGSPLASRTSGEFILADGECSNIPIRRVLSVAPASAFCRLVQVSNKSELAWRDPSPLPLPSMLRRRPRGDPASPPECDSCRSRFVKKQRRPQRWHKGDVVLLGAGARGLFGIALVRHVLPGGSLEVRLFERWCDLKLKKRDFKYEVRPSPVSVARDRRFTHSAGST